MRRAAPLRLIIANCVAWSQRARRGPIQVAREKRNFTGSGSWGRAAPKTFFLDVHFARSRNAGEGSWIFEKFLEEWVASHLGIASRTGTCQTRVGVRTWTRGQGSGAGQGCYQQLPTVLGAPLLATLGSPGQLRPGDRGCNPDTKVTKVIRRR